HVRVIVVKDEEGFPALGFDYPEGPVTPRPEPVAPDVVKIARRAAKSKRAASSTASPKRKPKGDGGGGGSGGVPVPVEPRSPSGSVPKVPLKTE
ncbi:MAG: ATP-dependent Clp protease ATP-binding subunit ClpA, partial [Alphaproteobacteria bacterium]